MNGVTREGYTFQTVLGSMGLNHMNGRVEDAVIGRFLSGDPLTTGSEFTQGWNRYSYVNNNPITYIAPSGFDCTVTATLLSKGGSITTGEGEDAQTISWPATYSYSFSAGCYLGGGRLVYNQGGGGQLGGDGLDEIVVTAQRPKKPYRPCLGSFAFASIEGDFVEGSAFGE